MENNRFAWPVCPMAEKSNMVVGAHYRFTVLTAGLIRMEYSENGIFEDRASQSVFYRDFPGCEYGCERNNGVLTLTTENLVLSYQEDMPFREDTLTVRLHIEPASTWHYGEDFEDLGGTVKTLDAVIRIMKQ